MERREVIERERRHDGKGAETLCEGLKEMMRQGHASKIFRQRGTQKQGPGLDTRAFRSSPCTKRLWTPAELCRRSTRGRVKLTPAGSDSEKAWHRRDLRHPPTGTSVTQARSTPKKVSCQRIKTRCTLSNPANGLGKIKPCSCREQAHHLPFT